MKDFIILLRRYIPPYKKYIVFNFIFNLLGAVFGAFSFVLLSPILGILFGTKEPVAEAVTFDYSLKSIEHNFAFYISNLIDKYGEESTLIYLGVFVILMVLLKVGFTYLASFVMVFTRNGIVRDIRSKIYNKIIGLPLGFFNDERKGDIITRMTGDVSEIENSIANSLEMMFKNPLIIIISLGAMIIMSWSLTLFVFIMLPVMGYIIGKVGKNLKKVSRKGQDKLGEILSIIEEDLSGLRVVKAFTAEKKAIKRFETENNNYLHIMNRLMWRRFLAHPMSEFLGTMVIVIVLWYGGSLILNDKAGSLKPEMFIVYLVFFYNIINPAKAFSTALYSVEKGMASMHRIDRILEIENEIKEIPNAEEISEFNSTIEYKNVSFSYAKESVLNGVSLSIPKGKTIALVGQSGSGKTTMVDLLPRFWDVTSGEITVDGHNIKNLKIKNLRNLIGNVNQEPILFNDTFYNNIAFGVENATQKEVENAAKIANAHEFIINSENGYDTVIGDRGDKLSGGQKQRVSIARAVLSNPPVLILDEATSSLDTESERLVQDALESLMQNRTSLVIAHRLSTIKNADLICVLHKGKIVEQGTHEELMELSGRYKKLHKMQMY